MNQDDSAAKDVPAEKILALSRVTEEMLRSIFLGDRQAALDAAARHIHKHVDCEAASIFLVPDDVPGYIDLISRYTDLDNSEKPVVRLRIRSLKRGGFTGHCANVAKVFRLYGKDLEEHEYIHDHLTPYLASTRCHSVLILPLKDGQGRLLGLIRADNKKDAHGKSENFRFDAVDESVAKILADKIVVLLESLRIVHEREETLRRLHESNELYASLIKNCPCHIFRKDRWGKITFMDERLCKLIGLPWEDIRDKTDKDLFPPRLAQKYADDDHYVFSHGDPFEDDEEFHCPRTNVRIWIHVIKTPIYDSARLITGIQGIFWDITARQELDKTQEIASLGHWKWDFENDHLSASNQVYRIFDLSPQSPGVKLSTLKEFVDPDDAWKWDEVVSTARLTKEAFLAEVRIQTAKGLQKWIHVKSEIEYDEEQIPCKMIGTIQDVTRRKRSQLVLSRGAVASAGVHDLKNPITYTRNDIELLRSKYETKHPGLAIELENVLKSFEKVFDSMETLLSVFKEGRITKRRVSAESIAKGCFGGVERIFQQHGKSVNFTVEIQSDVPEISVDYLLIYHVAENLVENAAASIPTGSELHLSISGDGLGNTLILLTDNGPGFTPEIINDFETHCASDSATGNGLGLLIAKAIAELHGGRMRIRNDETMNGARIEITLPI